MRNFRIEKLAEFKKMAESTGPLNQQEVSNIESFIDTRRKALGKEYVESVVTNLANQIYSGFLSENKTFVLNPLNHEAFKKNIISYIIFFLISTITAETFPVKIIRPGSGVIGAPEQLKELQLALANAIVDGRAALPDPKEWNKQNDAEKRRGTGRASSSGPQATNAPTELKAPIGTKLQELADDSIIYNYTIISPLEFSYFTGKTPEDKTNEASSKKVTSAYSKWERAAKTLNTLWNTSGKAAASSTATPAATTAPAAATEPATQAATESPADTLTTNVARLLSNVDAGQTYAGRTPFTNEQGMVRNMLKAINAIADKKNAVIDAPLSLAKIIVGANRSSLGRSTLANYDTTALASMSEKEIERTFRTELDIIMRSIVSFDQTLGGKKSYDQISRYINLETQTVKPDTTTPPAAKADDGQVKKSSFDKKFIKAATLRRLKIRSQMEAAIDSSAQMGRARVY